jgi:hypothetical protein
MAQSVVWTTEKTKSLIEMLEESPELWDTSSPLYGDRPKKNVAVGKFAEHFQIPHVEITKKLHNLRTQMNNEVRKIKKKIWREPMMWCSLQIGIFSIP